MKTFNQANVQELIRKGQSATSKYLTGSRDISLRVAKRVEPYMPIEVFTDPEVQKKYFGKIYLQEKYIKEENNKSITKA